MITKGFAPEMGAKPFVIMKWGGNGRDRVRFGQGTDPGARADSLADG